MPPVMDVTGEECMKEIPKMKPLPEMSKAELKDWIEWAEDEIIEYDEFIYDLNEELRKR